MTMTDQLTVRAAAPAPAVTTLSVPGGPGYDKRSVNAK